MSTPTLSQNNAQTLFKSVSLEHVARNKVQVTTSRTMRAVQGDVSYQYDSVDDTLDFCYHVDSKIFSD